MSNPNISIQVRVWNSPRADSRYPWKWAVQEGDQTIEFGAEETEEDAKREATEARASWIKIRTEATAAQTQKQEGAG